MNKLSSIGVLRIVIGVAWALFTFILFIAQPFYDLVTLFISYSFVTLGFGAVLGITWYKSPGKPIGAYLPVLILGFSYLGIQLLLAVIFVCVVNIVPMYFVWYWNFYWQVPITLIFVILFLLQHAAFKHIGKNEQRRQEETIKHEQIVLSINKVAASSKSARVRDEIDNLALQIRFMDLMQHPELNQADQEIINSIDTLNDLIVNGSDEEIISQARKCKLIVKQRKELSSMLQRK